MNSQQNRIFRNYYKFLSEHSTILKKKEDTLLLLDNSELFHNYIESLMDGLDDSQKPLIRQICQRERDFLLEESANISLSDSVSGYAVAYFPILTDIYSSDILYKAITHHTVSTPILTVPRMVLKAEVSNSDGTKKIYKFPRGRYLIRSTPENMNLLPGIQNNLFKMSASYPEKVNSKLSSVNKRYFILQEIEIQVHLDSTSVNVIQVPLRLRPDARGQLNTQFEFIDGDHFVIGDIIGNVDWDKGSLYYQVIYTNGDPTHSYITSFIKSGVIFSAKSGDIGRVKVDFTMDGWDFDIDVREDFEISLNSEIIQDYSDIYNIDLIKNLSEAIKVQVTLNRDWDIANLLSSAEPEMKKLNTYETINFNMYRDAMNIMSPSFLSGIYQTIVPRFSIVSRYMYLNYRAVPQFILTGIRSAALLENLQEFAVSLPTYREGVAGFDNLHAMNIHVNMFLKNIILSSPAIDDDKLYLLYKPDDENTEAQEQNLEMKSLSQEDKLRSTVLLNLIYKPLYLVEEITNSQKRIFIRSRTALELFRTEGVGVIVTSGLKDLVTSNDYEPYTRVV